MRRHAFFLTHHKCASSWLRKLIEMHCRHAGLSFFASHLSKPKLNPDKDYDVSLFSNCDYDNFVRKFRPWLDVDATEAVHVIRNPLDIVVSAYYSHLNTHSDEDWPALVHQRRVLRSLDKNSGLMSTWVFLERNDFHHGAVGPLSAIRRWNYADTRIHTVRMEDLVSDRAFMLENFASWLGNIPDEILDACAFESLSGGRKAGTVDSDHHYRSGKFNQWREEMDPSLALAIYHSYQPVIDRFYPEVGQMLSADSSRKQNGVVKKVLYSVFC